MKLSLKYEKIIEIIDILEENSRIFSNIGSRLYINTETIKNEIELLEICNEAISAATNTETNYSKFSEINLEELKDSFLKVLDYKTTIDVTQTEYNIIRSIDIYPGESEDYFVFDFNKNYNKDIINECQKALIFKDEINEELIRVIGKTFGEARTILYTKYNLRKDYLNKTIELDYHGYQIEIVLENRIKVCYLGYFDKNIDTFQFTNIFINGFCLL